MAAEAEPPIDRTTLHELCEARISAVHSCRAPAPEVVSSASGPGAAALKSNDAVHPEALQLRVDGLRAGGHKSYLQYGAVFPSALCVYAARMRG